MVVTKHPSQPRRYESPKSPPTRVPILCVACANYSWKGLGSLGWRTRAGVWNQQAYIKASNTAATDQFGAVGGGLSQIPTDAVALDGDTLVAGAGGEDSSATGVGGDQADNSAMNAGAVYVFE